MVGSPATWIGLCVVAFGLGARHGFDPDHLSVIDGVARRNIDRQPVVARMAGVLFSLGHGAVVLTAATAAVGLAASWRIPAWLETSGVLISLAFLLGLAALNLRTACAGDLDRPVAPAGWRSRFFRGSAKDHPLVVAGVGALFAISFDTLSQAAVIGVAAAPFGGLNSSLTAAACFVAGMVAVGGINGFWVSQMIGATGKRAAVASRVMTGAVGLLNLAVAGFAIARLAVRPLATWAEDKGLMLGAMAVGAMGLAAIVAIGLASRRGAAKSAAVAQAPYSM